MKAYKKIASIVIYFMTSSVLFSGIYTDSQRNDRIEKTQAFLDLDVRELDRSVIKSIGNPFAPQEVVETIVEKVKIPKTDAELLDLIIPMLQPDGVFSIGGSTFALFGEKRVKSGGEVTVKYENVKYKVQILKVTSSLLTVRLGEASKQIKIK